MVELRITAGNIQNTRVHNVGVLAIGSYLENHGPALPIDTDAKIASYIALQASINSGAKFLGIIYPSHEIETLDYGIYNPIEDLEYEIINTILTAKKYLNIKSVVIVNAHDGNIPIIPDLDMIEDQTNVLIQLNNSITRLNGIHAGTGELSVSKIIGLVNESEIENQSKTELYPEVGFSEYKKLQDANPKIKIQFEQIQQKGVCINENYGQELINLEIYSVLLDIAKLSDC